MNSKAPQKLVTSYQNEYHKKSVPKQESTKQQTKWEPNTTPLQTETTYTVQHSKNIVDAQVARARLKERLRLHEYQNMQVAGSLYKLVKDQKMQLRT